MPERGLQQAVAKWLISLGAVAVFAPAGTVLAQFEVMEPEVEEGAFEVEAIGSVHWGFDEADAEDEEEEEEEEQIRQGHEFSIGYGVTGFWKPEVGLVAEQEVDESIEATEVGIENTFRIWDGEDAPIGAGFFAAYETSLTGDDVHALEFGPIVQLPLGRLVTRLNPFFEKQFGDDREEGVGFEYAWQTAYEMSEELGIGFEAFGEIEDLAGDAPPTSEQEHRIGPVALLALELGALGELGRSRRPFRSDRPDRRLRLQVNLE